ncbi:MAG: Gfo/Idh/MocA family oxidoreductase [Pirellulaceae bacterium]|nr:Gfo/Idh/MocA family oxidoreductase [Pirellulaceae bacterium]
MRLRVGLIGQGSDWTTRYQPALRSLPDRFEVRAVYGSVSALSDHVAREFGAKREDSFRNMMRRSDIDAIMILESDWYGMVPLLAACEYNKAVYCSSSINFDPEFADQIRDRVEESGIAFMVELPRRFAPATLRLKELMATRLGKPRLLFCHRRLPNESFDSRESKEARQRSQYELVELIDWCRYLVGRNPNWVQAIRHPTRTELNRSDYQILSLGFGDPEKDLDAVLAQISCGAYMPAGWQEAIAFRPPAAVQVCCEKGIAFIDLPSTLIWFDDAGRHQEVLDTELPVGNQLLTQFHRAVTSFVRKTSDLEDTFRALDILRCAQRSMVTAERQMLE